MSSAFYPLGMKTYNNHVHQGGYRTWKGTGIFRNPIGITSTHIRPLTNLDPGNQFPTGFGLPRPIKHYRKGSLPLNTEAAEIAQTNPLVAFNLDRHVKSSHGTSLGGSRLGGGLLSSMIDTPGGYSVRTNTPTDGIPETCLDCKGIAVVSDWQPVTSLTEKPQPNVETKELCCNEERKAIQMTLPNSTMVQKNYYQTTYAKLYNRCKTFQQNQFAYLNGVGDPELLASLQQKNPALTAALLKQTKPGSPLALQLEYLYSAQCNPNYVVEGAVDPIDTNKCKKDVFKPNNYKYSKQGAVSSSNRLLQLNVETINKNLSQIKKGLNVKYNVCRENCYRHHSPL
jgi:hypothetical protein